MNNDILKELVNYGVKITPELRKKSLESYNLQREAENLDFKTREEVDDAVRITNDAKILNEIFESKKIILGKEDLLLEAINLQIEKDKENLHRIGIKIEELVAERKKRVEEIHVMKLEVDQSKIQALEAYNKANKQMEYADKLKQKHQLIKMEADASKASFNLEIEEIYSKKIAEQARKAEIKAKELSIHAEDRKKTAIIKSNEYADIKKKLDEIVNVDMNIEPMEKEKAKMKN